MNKTLAYIIAAIFEAIIIGLIVKYADYEVAILTLLIQINCRMLIKDLESKENEKNEK
jgi:hypothetical protein